MPALNAVAQAHGHVVAQIIEAELGVGAVGNIRQVGLDALHQPQMLLVFMRRFALEIHHEGLLAVLGRGRHLQHAHRQAKHLEDGRHPARIAAGQIIIDRYEVRAAPGERI